MIGIERNQERDSLFLCEDSYVVHVNPDTGKTQNMKSHQENCMFLAEQNCPLPILQNLVKVSILLHDSGKLVQEFYDYMEDVRKNGKNARKRQIDHASAGGRMIENMVGDILLSQLAGTAIYSHHGIQDCIDMDSGESLSEKRRQKEINFSEVEERFFRIVDKKSLLQYLRNANRDVKRICSYISDFEKRAGEANCGSKEFYLGMYERLILSVLIDSDWTDTACFANGEELPKRISKEETQKLWEESIQNFKKYKKDLKENGKKSALNVYRDEISELCYEASQSGQKLYRLTVPTGAGKTLASLRFALYHAQKYQKRHIIYVAPYNSILDQNAEDIRKAVGNDDIVLEHHCNVFYEDEKREETYKKLTENWDSTLIATTAVQMLNTLFSSQKSSIRRMYNLCNSIIIFDEVQALPVRGTELFHLAVNFLTEFCNTTVILCSATQPSLARTKENNLFRCKEMIEDAEKYRDAFKRVEFEDKTNLVPGGMEPEDLGEFARKSFQKYGSVLVIVNTKACAKRVYEALKQSCEEEYELYHLSTSMCPENRKEELEAIKNKLKEKKNVICVSTQLIEAGVNLSFGCVIRSLAGLDSIIQAAGRCNRHKEQDMGKVYVIKMAQDAEQLGNLADIRQAGEASEKFFYHFHRNPEELGNSLDSEEAIKAYYQIYFQAAGSAATKYPSRIPGVTLEELLGRNDTGQRQYIRKHNGRSRKSPLNQAFRTAGEDYQVIPENEKVTIIVPYDAEAEEAISIVSQKYTTLSEKKRALRRLQRYSVGIPEELAKKLNNALQKIGDTELLVLSMDYYDKKLGVLDTPKIHFLEF